MRARSVAAAALLAGTGLLALAPAAASASAPSVTVTPGGGLVEGQRVTVAGTGFGAGSLVGAEECGVAAAFGCSGIEVTTTAGADGAFSLTLTVHVEFQDVGPVVDCRAVGGGCAIVVHGNGPVVTPIVFASVQPPPIAITAAPEAGLQDHDVVTVDGTHFPAGQQVHLAECEAGPSPLSRPPRCGPPLSLTADASGAFTLPFRVARFLPGANAGRVDCAAPGTRCVLQAAFADDLSRQAQTPVAFLPADRQASAAIVVTPSSGLIDAQPITITGGGFAPNEAVTLTECRDGVLFWANHWCSVRSITHVTTDGRGTFAAPTVARSRVDTPLTGCRTSCYVLAVAEANPAGDQASAPIAFRLYAHGGPGRLVVLPAGGLADGVQVTISETGFAPNANLDVLECAGTPGRWQVCRSLSDVVLGAFAGPDGSFTARYPVLARLAAREGPGADCTVVAGACAIVVGDRADLPRARSTPLDFTAAGGTGPTASPVRVLPADVTRVTVGAEADARSAGAREALPFTGSASRELALGALWAVAAGLALVGASRRPMLRSARAGPRRPPRRAR